MSSLSIIYFYQISTPTNDHFVGVEHLKVDERVSVLLLMLFMFCVQTLN